MAKESPDSCPKLILTEINPFSKLQAAVISLILEGRDYQQIAHILGYHHQSIKNLVAAKAGYSIYSTVEKITGRRPSSEGDLVAILSGDVVLLKKD